jgi:hypothetical protein
MNDRLPSAVIAMSDTDRHDTPQGVSMSQYRPRRSMLYIPACVPRFLAKGRELKVDSLILDLEESVLVARKTEARRNAVAALKEGGYGYREVDRAGEPARFSLGPGRPDRHRAPEAGRHPVPTHREPPGGAGRPRRPGRGRWRRHSHHGDDRNPHGGAARRGDRRRIGPPGLPGHGYLRPHQRAARPHHPGPTAAAAQPVPLPAGGPRPTACPSSTACTWT